MEAWSNIQISPGDPENKMIDKLQKRAGKLPEKSGFPERQFSMKVRSLPGGPTPDKVRLVRYLINGLLLPAGTDQDSSTMPIGFQ
jgi:hypothetical protein